MKKYNKRFLEESLKVDVDGNAKGAVLEVKEEKGKLVARKKGSEDPTESVYGVLKRKESSDELVNLLRGPAEKD